MNYSDVKFRVSRAVRIRSVGVRYAMARLTYDRSDQRRQLHGLRDVWRDRPALIVANGPSLNVTPLNEFAGVPSIGMNKIDLIYPRVKWRPSMVLCVNNLVAAQNQRAWVDAGVPVYASWKCRSAIHRELRKHFFYFLSAASRDFSTDVSMGVGSAGTVTYTALQFAYHTGANPVIIVGLDHSFAGVDPGKENIIETRKGPDVNHFDHNYFANGQRWGIPNLPLSEEGYRIARETFEANGRRVLDATIGGKLTVFDKLDVSDAIDLMKSA